MAVHAGIPVEPRAAGVNGDMGSRPLCGEEAEGIVNSGSGEGGDRGCECAVNLVGCGVGAVSEQIVHDGDPLH